MTTFHINQEQPPIRVLSDADLDAVTGGGSIRVGVIHGITDYLFEHRSPANDALLNDLIRATQY